MYPYLLYLTSKICAEHYWLRGAGTGAVALVETRRPVHRLGGAIPRASEGQSRGPRQAPQRCKRFAALHWATDAVPYRPQGRGGDRLKARAHRGVTRGLLQAVAPLLLACARACSTARRDGAWRAPRAHAARRASVPALPVSATRSSRRLAHPWRTKRTRASAARGVRPWGAPLALGTPRRRAHRIAGRASLSHGGLRKGNPDSTVMTGFYRSPGIAVGLKVHGSREAVTVEGILDTGCNRFLCLPISLAVSLGLELVDVETSERADGTVVEDECVFQGQAEWDGALMDIPILLTRAQQF